MHTQFVYSIIWNEFFFSFLFPPRLCNSPWTTNASKTTVSLCSVALKPCCRTIPEMIKRGKWKVTSCHISSSLGWNVRLAGPWGWHPPYTNAPQCSEWRRGVWRGENEREERDGAYGGKTVEDLRVNKPVQKQLILSLPISEILLSSLSPSLSRPLSLPFYFYLSLSIAVGVRQIPQPQSDRPSNDLARKPSIN